MKNVNGKDLPAVSGGVKPSDTGDCLPEIPLPEYPQFPTVPIEIDHTNL